MNPEECHLVAQTRRITDYFPPVIPPPLHGATLPIRKLNPYLLLSTRISAKWTRNVHVKKNETTQVLEGNIDGFIYTLGVGEFSQILYRPRAALGTCSYGKEKL